MQKQYCIIDASVLIHDPESLYALKNKHIVVPSAVLEELDRKKRYNDEVGRNARQVMRMIDELSREGTIRERVDLKNGSTLQVLLEEDVRFKKQPSSFYSPDRLRFKILLAAMKFKEEGLDVIILSKDPVTKIMAETVGVRAEGYSSGKEDYDRIYKGIFHQDISQQQMNVLLSDGKLKFTGAEEPHPNSFFILQDGKKTAACRFDHKSGSLVPIKEVSNIWGIKPRNVEQRCALDLLLRPEVKLISFVGPAGTGKTLLALAAGLKQVFDDGLYQRIIVARSIIPLGKDIGFLPGTKEDKLQAWLAPFFDNLDFICNVGKEELGKETKKWIVESEKFQLEAITYMRGRSFSDTFVIIDEAQNLTPHELKTIISRVGENTKIVILGDPTQIDNPYLDQDSNGLVYLVGRMKHFDLFGSVFFETTERSRLARLAAEAL
ncbi:MAG: hypothetical protein A3F09_04015 [Chlamydiae bacterium RIFCSPHIGHO2_12_FULL_49_11]|nr:MAG: hypothetical protein A3F09_04015 [Chlamydiae bacterium RIFCSPHIGHO2_12_FULL_49_11]